MNSTNQSVLELFLQFCNLTALKESDPFKFLPSLPPSSDLELLNKSIRSEQGHTRVNTSFLKRNSMRINMSMLITVGPYWAQLLRSTEAPDSQQNLDFMHKGLHQTGRRDWNGREPLGLVPDSPDVISGTDRVFLFSSPYFSSNGPATVN